MRREPQAVVRSTLPEVASVAWARRSRHRRRTGCAGRSRRRCPQPAQPARASETKAAKREARDRRGGTNGTVEPCVTAAAEHAAVSGASRRPSEARNERSEWRREGYPPEGSRPRSGLGRVARSRSDAPKLLAPGTARRSGICTTSTTGTVNLTVRVTATVFGTGGGEIDSVGVSASIIGGVTVIAIILVVAVTVSDKGKPPPSRLPARTVVAV